jgi:hypothetical protein
MLFPGDMRRIHCLLVVLAASAALAVPLVAHAKALGFEGRIALRLQDVEPQGANYTIRGDRVSIEVPSIGRAHDLRIVFDSARLPSLAPGGAPDVAITRTGRWRMVVGQLCETWTLKDASGSVDACVVPNVAWVDPRRAVGGEVPAWSAKLESERAFPVSVTSGTNFSWATDVVRGRVPDSAFVTPPATRAR